jgi:hypothetical protein
MPRRFGWLPVFETRIARRRVISWRSASCSSTVMCASSKPTGDQFFGLSDGRPIGEHATGLLAQQRNLHWPLINVAEVVLDIAMGCFDILDVLMDRRDAAHRHDVQWAGGVLGFKWCAGDGHSLSPCSEVESHQATCKCYM